MSDQSDERKAGRPAKLNLTESDLDNWEKGKIQLSEIAGRAGVSVAAVSKAMKRLKASRPTTAPSATTEPGKPVAAGDPMLVQPIWQQGPEGFREEDVMTLAKSAAYGALLQAHRVLITALAHMVRSMNCYYSNLIEGHNTHPIDIEKAMQGDYSANKKKRNLQLEAKAHIAVQKWIDEGGLKGRTLSTEGLREIHRRFCELLPEELLWVEDEATGKREQVIPGEFRERDVAVGQHIAVSPGAIAAFLGRFEEVYGRLGKSETVLAAAAAHHRFAWIHPFLDGNGRVARLMSHASLLETLDTGAVWSISRGLARSVDTYKSHLANCDLPRRNDLDGRGNLSEEALDGVAGATSTAFVLLQDAFLNKVHDIAMGSIL